jgi:hypothetical protein
MHPERYTARDARERRVACAWLIHRLGWVYDQHAEDEMHVVTRDFFEAGWTALALQHAFFQLPGGGEYPGPLDEPRNRDRSNPVRIRTRWGLLTSRLDQWRGTPLPGRKRGRALPPPLTAEEPRRGRPTGATSRRRRLVETVERLPQHDQRRIVALAALRGEPVTVSWTRTPAAAAALAQMRESTPDSRLRRPELRALLDPDGADGTGAARRADLP